MLLAIVRPVRGERARLVTAALLGAGATAAAVGLLAISGYLVVRAAQHLLIAGVAATIVLVQALAIARAALRYGERLASHDLALRQLARLRQRFFRALAPLVPSQLNGRARGDLLARFVSDVDTLQDAHLRILIPVLVAAVVIVGAGVAGALMLGAMGAALLAALSVTAIVSAWVSARVAAMSGRNRATARAQLTDRLVEAIDGSAELALAGRSGEYVRRLSMSDARLARLARRDALASALAGGLHTLLMGAGLVAVLLVAVDGVRSGSLPPLLLAAVVFLFLGAGEALAPVPVAVRRLRGARAAAARLGDICEQQPAVADPESPKTAPRSGALALEGVSFSYQSDGETVLRDADLRLEPGAHVALTGASGAGKSTLAELLVRFRDPDRGRVTLDGIDVRELAQEEVRGAVLLCDQDAHLFNVTIRENLSIVGREVSEVELWSALAVVELDRFVHGLEDGLDTIVGQQGELLSGGQRQRLALARALLSDARFLILDEPVAQLDGPLARRVVRAVLTSAHARGVLMVTHATGALDGFDRVLRLEQGRVASDPR